MSNFYTDLEAFDQDLEKIVKLGKCIKTAESHVLPQTESQARPLTKLEPEEQREVWEEIVTENQPEEITAAKVEAKVNEKLQVHFSSESHRRKSPRGC